MAESTIRKLRKRRLNIDADEAVDQTLAQVETAQRERTLWMDQRLTRYAKFRGWLESKDYPWDNASNQHIPLMLASALRIEAGLHNAVLGLRPVMTAKPTRPTDKPAAERVSQLIDFQLFVEGNAEQRIGDFITNFTIDGTAVGFVQWARDRRRQVDVRVRPRPTTGTMIEAMALLLPQEFPGATNVVAEDAEGWRWSLTMPDPETPIEVEVAVWDRDEDTIELVVTWEQVVFDGPTLTVHALEDIVVPMRCENAQPVTPENPFGAPWVARLIRIDLDTIRRRQQAGIYDLLTKKDLKELAEQGSARIPRGAATTDEESLKEEKDTREGRHTQWGEHAEDREWFTMVEWYGRWDVDGDGLDEDVILWVLKEPRRLVRARYLTEIYPGSPPRRPFCEARYITVPGQFYGIGPIEIMEGLHDFLHVVLNQAIDNGTIANDPFGFYRASSGIKGEIWRPMPGELYPVDNPQTDIAFPIIPHADQSFAFNMFSLGKQIMDETTQIGPLQRGQVPQGKASAVRTAATTMALLQQGAAMPEQVLRRLFAGLRTLWELVHTLNTRYLPKKKSYLIAGKPLDQDDAYGVIDSPDEIAVPLAFDFQATLLNTNKGIVGQTLRDLGAALVSPMTLQMGLVGPEQIYNWLKDLIQAGTLDDSRYLKRPAGMPEGPRMMAEEAIVMLLDGKLPEAAPLEPPEEHYQKLLKFSASDEFGLFVGGRELLFREYLQRILQLVTQAQQRQQMMQAAAQFQQAMGGQGGGGNGAMGMGAAPPMQPMAPDQREIMGATQRGGEMGR